MTVNAVIYNKENFISN